MASSSTSIALCASFSTHCKITSHQNSPLLSLFKHKPFSNSHKLAFSYSPLSTRPTSSLIPKFSESQATLVDSQPEASEPEPAPVVEAASEEQSKREEIFAVVMIGSRQYIVFPGRYIYTQRLKGANVNDKIILNKVLLVGTKTNAYIGKPVVTNAAVHAVVEDQGLNPKVVIFKYKKKKNYRRNIGHRQRNTRIRITGITGYQDYPAAAITS